MRLEVLLPYRVFIDTTDISRIVAETSEGSFGLLPRRRDCVAAIVPGILAYQSDADGEVFVAVDEGVLTKIGDVVTVAVRRASRGNDLDKLRDAVQRDYLTLDALQQSARIAARKLESGFVAHFTRFHGE